MKIVLLIFLTISTLNLTLFAGSVGSGITIDCDPNQTSKICYTKHVNGFNQNVPGEFLGTRQKLDPLQACSSSQSGFTDIFIHGMGLIGNGVGYFGGIGCDDISNNEVWFYPDSTVTVVNNFQLWLNTVNSY